jgi:hypothetical protein
MRHQQLLQIEANAGISDTYGLASMSSEIDFLYDEFVAEREAARVERELREGDEAEFELDL